MSIQREEFLRFIKLLNDNSCLGYVVLIGSWAEYLYKESGMIRDFDPNIKTLDIDFLLKNMKHPKEPVNLIELAKASGYLVESDYMTGATKIYDKRGLEIEFLLGKAGAGSESALKTNLGVSAQTLRHMGIILNNTITVEYYDMEISVPTPEAYLIHKMVINHERGKKQEKDRDAIINMWKYRDLDTYNRIYITLTKKEKALVDRFIADNQLEL